MRCEVSLRTHCKSGGGDPFHSESVIKFVVRDPQGVPVLSSVFVQLCRDRHCTETADPDPDVPLRVPGDAQKIRLRMMSSGGSDTPHRILSVVEAAIRRPSMHRRTKTSRHTHFPVSVMPPSKEDHEKNQNDHAFWSSISERENGQTLEGGKGRDSVFPNTLPSEVELVWLPEGGLLGLGSVEGDQKKEVQSISLQAHPDGGERKNKENTGGGRENEQMEGLVRLRQTPAESLTLLELDSFELEDSGPVALDLSVRLCIHPSAPECTWPAALSAPCVDCPATPSLESRPLCFCSTRVMTVGYLEVESRGPSLPSGEPRRLCSRGGEGRRKGGQRGGVMEERRDPENPCEEPGSKLGSEGIWMNGRPVISLFDSKPMSVSTERESRGKSEETKEAKEEQNVFLASSPSVPPLSIRSNLVENEVKGRGSAEEELMFLRLFWGLGTPILAVLVSLFLSGSVCILSAVFRREKAKTGFPKREGRGRDRTPNSVSQNTGSGEAEIEPETEKRSTGECETDAGLY
uniref:Uncharacterized protein n=1 Tax=Chromera velia CCMP2878 TaxID=1169474 RepID=A0A0G4I1R8_9ALVE|eukprot:Cvel_10192.t1-p1 / transcript=Cvel_10192.t1 / gene=Cvel_10192 / organism=Chromera_velia_CCMP2878 / gene_product=hypothetical protein / transcript_product=hypothetical protein / location=Cvel_scaffold609:38494-42583(+) / protein_length=518 / sequence_SO=supercontig / SO=protein_coding / is_pseudo=false